MGQSAVEKILRRTLFLVKCGWTKGRLARTESGRSVDVYSRKAARFCISGAHERASVRHLSATKAAAWRQINIASRYPSVIGFNDASTTKKKDVVELLERAIQNSKKV
jgi:hypothetical protein